MRGRKPTTTRRVVTVNCYEPAENRSVSFTIYPAFDSVLDIARSIQRAAEGRWRTTDVDDDRHKRH